MRQRIEHKVLNKRRRECVILQFGKNYKKEGSIFPRNARKQRVAGAQGQNKGVYYCKKTKFWYRYQTFQIKVKAIKLGGKAFAICVLTSREKITNNLTE